MSRRRHKSTKIQRHESLNVVLFGTEFLKPVFDALGGEIDYEELKIIRLYFHQGP